MKNSFVLKVFIGTILFTIAVLTTTTIKAVSYHKKYKTKNQSLIDVTNILQKLEKMNSGEINNEHF